MSVSEFVYDIARHHNNDEHTLTIDLSDDESYFITSRGRVLYEGDEVVYPYFRMALVRYLIHKT